MDYRIVEFKNETQYKIAMDFFKKYADAKELSVDIWEDEGATFEGKGVEINIYKGSSQVFIEGDDEKVSLLEKFLKEEIKTNSKL